MRTQQSSTGMSVRSPARRARERQAPVLQVPRDPVAAAGGLGRGRCCRRRRGCFGLTWPEGFRGFAVASDPGERVAAARLDADDRGLGWDGRRPCAASGTPRIRRCCDSAHAVRLRRPDRAILESVGFGMGVGVEGPLLTAARPEATAGQLTRVPSAMTQSAQFGVPAGVRRCRRRLENRVQARSIDPHQEVDGADLRQPCRRSATELADHPGGLQQLPEQWAAAGPWEACLWSSAKGIAGSTSFGRAEIRVSSPARRAPA
jgi:hypothetical protein